MKLTHHEAVANIMEWAAEKKAEKTISIDVKGKTDYTDTIIICDGLNEIHLKAIADHIIDQGKKFGLELLAIEGYQSATWILLDFIDIIVHIFQKKYRELYRLEELWQINSKNRKKIETKDDQRED
ncbi:MAG: ribosome silencing factor [Candidatus Cloacimonetes bacterium]|nr:ribosome silencing factor [Candidatus Cloacimonadota bacterium]